jgi:hypothetical protein
MVKNFSKIVKTITPQIWEAQRTPSGIISQKTKAKPAHITFIQSPEKPEVKRNICSQREKTHGTERKRSRASSS